MTAILSLNEPRQAGGVVDNARALTTAPPAPQQQAERTFHLSYKADILTRYGQDSIGFLSE